MPELPNDVPPSNSSVSQSGADPVATKARVQYACLAGSFLALVMLGLPQMNYDPETKA